MTLLRPPQRGDTVTPDTESSLDDTSEEEVTDSDLSKQERHRWSAASRAIAILAVLVIAVGAGGAVYGVHLNSQLRHDRSQVSSLSSQLTSVSSQLATTDASIAAMKTQLNNATQALGTVSANTNSLSDVSSRQQRDENALTLLEGSVSCAVVDMNALVNGQVPGLVCP
jgi:uncharacterized protein HemX